MATYKFFFSVFAAVALLAACGKKEPAAPLPPPSAAPSSTSVPALERRAAGSRSYAAIDMSWDSLPQADFAKARAQVRGLYWSGAEKKLEKLAEDFSDPYRRDVPNGTGLVYKARNEAEAREIEGALAAQRAGGARDVLVDTIFLGSVAGTLYAAGDLADTALFLVDAIDMVDKNSGKTLFTLGRAGELGPLKANCNTTREALKIPEPSSTDKSSMGGMYSSSPAFC